MTADSRCLFFSYKSDDVEFVRPVCECLLAHGYSPWFNEFDIPYDHIDEFQRFINRGIDTASWGVLFANDRYARSAYCNIEVERLLRRLPVERLFVFQTTECPRFKDDYPELAGRHFVIRGQAEVFEHLRKAGVIDDLSSPPTFNPLGRSTEWRLKEIGARFNSFPWHYDAKSSVWQKQSDDLDLGLQAEVDVFAADFEGRSVRLLVDCRLLEANFAESLRQRTKESPEGAIRFLEDEQDDRQRLREELQHFGREVATVQRLARDRRLARATEEGGTDVAAFEAIGVHVFNTVESLEGERNAYKHRLFSYRLGERIYRVYKLGLPQPQLGVPVAVRFIFQFERDRRAFFRALPFCDAVVRSFSWVTLATRPKVSLDDLRQAALRARRGRA